MKILKLSKVTEINPGFIKSTETMLNMPVSFVPMAAVSEVHGSIINEEERQLGDVLNGFTYFQNNDVLVAKITPCFENGKIAFAQIKNKSGFGSTEFHVIRAKPALLESKYLFHFLRQQYIRIEGARKMTGSAGQRRIPRYFIEGLEIPLPSLNEQKRIAAILDKADALREKRRQAIAKLDALLQSVFLDMFGDPATNPKGWKVFPLPYSARVFTDGPFGSNLKTSHYRDEGVRVVRLQNIGVGQFLDNDKSYISTEHFNSLPRNHCLPGDVLIGTLGDPNLRACILPDHIPEALNKADCVLLKLDRTKATSEYLCWLLNNPSVLMMASGLILGQTRLRISMGRLKTLNVPLPPLERQQEFTCRVNKVNALQLSVKSSSEKIEALFHSLQQRAFNGELFNNETDELKQRAEAGANV